MAVFVQPLRSGSQSQAALKRRPIAASSGAARNYLYEYAEPSDRAFGLEGMRGQLLSQSKQSRSEQLALSQSLAALRPAGEAPERSSSPSDGGKLAGAGASKATAADSKQTGDAKVLQEVSTAARLAFETAGASSARERPSSPSLLFGSNFSKLPPAHLMVSFGAAAIYFSHRLLQDYEAEMAAEEEKQSSSPPPQNMQGTGANPQPNNTDSQQQQQQQSQGGDGDQQVKQVPNPRTQEPCTTYKRFAAAPRRSQETAWRHQQEHSIGR